MPHHIFCFSYAMIIGNLELVCLCKLYISNHHRLPDLQCHYYMSSIHGGRLLHCENHWRRSIVRARAFRKPSLSHNAWGRRPLMGKCLIRIFFCEIWYTFRLSLYVYSCNPRSEATITFGGHNVREYRRHAKDIHVLTTLCGCARAITNITYWS
jgi:hypothetical protein